MFHLKADAASELASNTTFFPFILYRYMSLLTKGDSKLATEKSAFFTYFATSLKESLYV